MGEAVEAFCAAVRRVSVGAGAGCAGCGFESGMAAKIV